MKKLSVILCVSLLSFSSFAKDPKSEGECQAAELIQWVKNNPGKTFGNKEIEIVIKKCEK